MKKILALLLSALMLLSFAACNGSSQPGDTTAAPTEPAATLKVGYGREAYSPKHNVQLAGYGMATERLATDILDDVCVTCIAFVDGNGTTALLFSIDSSSSGGQTTTQTLRAVSKATGVPVENMFYSSTHTHSGPYNVAAADELKKASVAAATTALENAKPAEMFIGSTNTTNLNFVRHYKMSEGGAVGDNHGVILPGATRVGHMTDADSQMQLVKFVREGEKDIIMMNWQAHPTLAAGNYYTMISADYIGTCRQYMEKEANCDFVYFQGASGNLNAFSQIDGENDIGRNHVKHGEALAKTAIAALGSLTPAGTDAIKLENRVFVATNAKNSPEEMEMLNVYLDVIGRGGSDDEAELATDSLINSNWEVISIQARAKNTKETTDISILAMTIGDLSFVGAPYEMFDTNGMYIKENTPFDMTFILGYCNDGHGYIASEYAFEYGCYEVDTREFVQGTAEALADEYLDMLGALKGE